MGTTIKNENKTINCDTWLKIPRVDQNADEYIGHLAQVDSGKIQFIVFDEMSGIWNRWSIPVEVKDVNNIEKEELSRILIGFSYEIIDIELSIK